MEFLGYSRSDGRVGVRNHFLILSTVVCATEGANRIKWRKPSAVTGVHPFGCAMLGVDLKQFRRTLFGFTRNPNVGAVLVDRVGDSGWVPHCPGAQNHGKSRDCTKDEVPY